MKYLANILELFKSLQILQNPSINCFNCFNLNCGFLLIKYLLFGYYLFNFYHFRFIDFSFVFYIIFLFLFYISVSSSIYMWYCDHVFGYLVNVSVYYIEKPECWPIIKHKGTTRFTFYVFLYECVYFPCILMCLRFVTFMILC